MSEDRPWWDTKGWSPPDWTMHNEDGLWCSFCGDILALNAHIDEDFTPPEDCSNCGAPDDLEQMTEYFA